MLRHLKVSLPFKSPLQRSGYSLIELIVGIGILGLLVMVAKVSYSRYIDKTHINIAISDIKVIELVLLDYRLTYDSYPESLNAINISIIDPWGNPYQYLALEGIKKKKGHSRKDHSMVPINSDFDLYSLGEDGKSSPPLTAKASKDDIIRGNDGAFVGLGSDF